jgi:hypothetical protein
LLPKPIKDVVGNSLGLYSINNPAPRKKLFTYVYVDELVRGEAFVE